MPTAAVQVRQPPRGSALRYLRLLGLQIRVALLGALQYRADFFAQGLMTLNWFAFCLVPLVLVYRDRPAIAGWSFPEALVLVGWFALLQGVMEGAINPSLTAVVEHIRKGTLDFILIKPADAQFLVSTAKFAPWRVLDGVTAVAIWIFAFAKLHRLPTPGGVGAAAILLVASVAVLYSLWILAICAAFWVVRLDNLAYLFDSILDFARWPVSVFRGTLRFVFTFVIPLAILTTYPAQALLGHLSLRTGLFAVGGATIFATLARWLWSRAIAHYTSASS
jgi:ABC-2 type transport system permease protein